jgi:Asp-tRNA(Asn)/Glu-tRNA(Gln) amidotransferase C subunit
LSHKTKKPAAPSAVITLDQVRRLAALSRLNLRPAEELRLQGEFSSILGYFRLVDGAGDRLPPESRSILQELRADHVAPSDPKVLEGVPRRKGRWVRAPRVY